MPTGHHSIPRPSRSHRRSISREFLAQPLHEVDPTPISGAHSLTLETSGTVGNGPIDPTENLVPDAEKLSPGNIITRNLTVDQFFQWTRGAQKYSSFIFTGFLTLHSASVIIAPLISIPVGNSTIQATEEIYQVPIIESVLVYGSLGVHIGSGMILRARRLYLDKKNYAFFTRPSSVAIAGYVLTPIVLGHMIASRVAPQTVLGDSSLISLDYITFGFARHRWLMWLTYGPLILLTFYHVSFGWRRWLGLFASNKRKKSTYAITYLLTLAGWLSALKISLQPPVQGWLAKQYDLVFKALWL